MKLNYVLLGGLVAVFQGASASDTERDFGQFKKEPDATAKAPEIVSDFSSGFDGWVFTSGMSWQSDGGNPGGYLRYDDDGPANSGQVFAPAKFLGDWRPYLQGCIKYDYAIFRTGQANFSRALYISGPGGAASWVGPRLSGPVSWSSLVAPLGASYWGVSSGTWAELIKNVTSFMVYMPDENSSLLESTGLDNVRLIPRGSASCTPA